jgi:GH35 family endo-1,4-beta-xylanase
VQLIFPSKSPIKKGDVLCARVYLRAIDVKSETREAQVEFIFQRTISPYTVQFRRMLGVTGTWERHDYRWRANEDLPAGDGGLVFRISYERETIDVGGALVLNLGNSASLDDLPETRISYEGREADAPWRKQAADRIEQNRKAELTINVADASGKPVQDAQTHVTLRRHAFGFGNIASRFISDAKPDPEMAKRWEQIYLDTFNTGVSTITWRWWVTPWGRQQNDRAVAWYRANGITDLHGTHVIWAKWMRIPTSTGKSSGSYKGVDWKNTAGNDNDNNASLGEYNAHVKVDGVDAAREWLRQRVHAHIKEVMSANASQLTSCNVVNEQYDEHVLTDIFGMDEMAEWFKLAHATAPNVKLYLNDNGIIGPDSTHENAYCETIKFLLDHGAPLQGIGEQSHFGAKPPGMSQVERITNRLAAFGLPLEITEFDFDSEDERLQADYIRDYLTFMFSHPSVIGVTQWGFWQGDHWKPNAGLWRKDWSPKPAARVLQDLILKQWHTDQTGKTDAAGSFHVRGFLGQYDVQVKSGDVSQAIQADLIRGGSTVTVKLK